MSGTFGTTSKEIIMKYDRNNAVAANATVPSNVIKDVIVTDADYTSDNGHVKYNGTAKVIDYIPKSTPGYMMQLDYTFSGKTSIIKVTATIPTVYNLQAIFSGCTSLKELPVLPDTVEVLNGAFMNCASVTGEIFIPDSVKGMTAIFANTAQSIIMKYNSTNTVAANVEVPANVTKVPISA
jgi:hypothetical protein